MKSFAIILLPAQIVFVTASLWLLLAWVEAARNYFRWLTWNLVIYFGAIGAGYWVTARAAPKFLESIASNPILRHIAASLGIKYGPALFAVLNRKLLPIAVGFLFADIAYVYAVRSVYPRFQEWLFKRRRNFLRSEANLGVRRIKSVQEYFKPGYYFIGATGRGPGLFQRLFFRKADKGLLYLSPAELRTHVQVTGPSGVGKTKSCLVPLARQAAKNGVSCIFFDGKGDTQLLQEITDGTRDVLVFDPLNPDNSHSYNPLRATRDPHELMNMLAVGMDLNAPGEAKIYTDIQKKYLTTLFALMASMNLPFNFIDVLEFTDYGVSRDRLLAMNGSRYSKLEMENLLSRLSTNLKELMGLSVQLDSHFTADEGISALINTYQPDINFKNVLAESKTVIASFSTGKKAQTSEALAKMMLADIANAVSERRRNKENPFCLLILDEFGQYVPDHFDKFITTCRDTNVAVVLSHQSNAQLETKYGSNRLARIVRENTATKIIFRQSEEAAFWADIFGTKVAYKRTQQTETGLLGTEKMSKMGSIKEVEEYLVHPNRLRTLGVGQATFRTGSQSPGIIHCSMWRPPAHPFTKASHPSGVSQGRANDKE